MSEQNKNSEQAAYESAKMKNQGKSKALKLEVAGVFINTIAIAVCSLTLGAAMTFKVPPEILAVSDNGSYFEKTPLDVSNKTDEEMKQWVTDRIVEAFSYNFTNQAEHAVSVAHHYTPEALASLDGFINGSSQSGKFVESMLKRRVVKDAGVVKMLLADGITLSSGKVRNTAGWQASTKGALVMHTKGGIIRLGRYTITMVVIRADENENQDGIKIQSIQMEKLS
ncbi:DotI/IcmL/TraM family protein [Vibrio coralliirubri]|uniref:DotI/IcmL/TraM family protein n=1 Tax=Vibrio coralliirubri TaxID=1516159 RepID=UPI0022844E65|nr:DotI/IcmL/TraM family protein [Vibrio coralliirubri]MCY9866141.1 DotI/IcmL/TraM family protein [Vibrio coralliirubri]